MPSKRTHKCYCDCHNNFLKSKVGCGDCNCNYGRYEVEERRNWAERIEIAKAAREGGRILREGKAKEPQ